MRDDLDFSRPLDCDVAIAGAGLSGLVCGAILARHGRRVVVVDAPPEVGGRAGATPHRGYWLDLGHRDGSDVGDLQLGWRWGQLAAAEADVDVPLREVEPTLRVHRLAESAGEAALGVVEAHWGPKGFARLASEALGCPPDRLADFAAALARLAGAPSEVRRAAVTLPLPDWLARHVREPEVRRALSALVTVVYCEHPERASAGRLMGFLAPQPELPKLVTAMVDHPELGGMQGLVAPFARAIEARGGRVLTNLAPAGVAFDGARATGLVAVDGSHLALELRARAVVLTPPLWDALRLLPAARVAPDMLELARALEDEQADAVGWVAGLRRLPRLRASGEPESHVGWNRLLVGPERRYLGGFHLPSLASRRAAPPGRHLLHAFVGRWLARGERPGWGPARAAIERVLAHLREFYLDLDDCVEWSALRWVGRPACLAWYWAPRLRHGVRVAGADGCYLASGTFESEAGPIDVCAHAGLEAARAVLADAGAA